MTGETVTNGPVAQQATTVGHDMPAGAAPDLDVAQEARGAGEVAAASHETGEAPATSHEADAETAGEAGQTEPDLADALASLRQVHDRLDALVSTVDDLAAAVGNDQERAAFRESVIDRLHAENQQLRRGERESLLSPVRNGLFRLHDMALRAAAQCRAADQAGSETGAALLAAVADETGNVLLSIGVERFDAIPGERFDPGRHRPVAVRASHDAAHDNTVAEARTAGFVTDQKVVRRADVVVARHAGADGEVQK